MFFTEKEISGFSKENNLRLTKEFMDRVSLKQDKIGTIVLSKKDYIDSVINLDNFDFSKKWITLRNLSMALIKDTVPEGISTDYSETEKEVLVANNFVLPELVRQFQVTPAEYYFARFTTNDKSVEKGKKYLFTPSFRGKKQELIHLADIVGKENFKASEMEEKLEEYFRLRRFPEIYIDRLKQDFVKQTICNTFIEFTDEHNLNAGVLVDQSARKMKLAPSYDLDFSMGVYKNLGWQSVVTTRKADNGKDDLESILMQYKDLPWMKSYLSEVLENLSLEKSIKSGEEISGMKLSEKGKKHYEIFFGRQKAELEATYQKMYGKTIEER